VLGAILIGQGFYCLQFICDNWGQWFLFMASILAGVFFFGFGIDRLNL